MEPRSRGDKRLPSGSIEYSEQQSFVFECITLGFFILLLFGNAFAVECGVTVTDIYFFCSVFVAMIFFLHGDTVATSG